MEPMAGFVLCGPLQLEKDILKILGLDEPVPEDQLVLCFTPEVHGKEETKEQEKEEEEPQELEVVFTWIDTLPVESLVGHTLLPPKLRADGFFSSPILAKIADIITRDKDLERGDKIVLEFRQDKSSVSTVNGIEDPFQAPDSYPFAAVEYLVLFAEYEDDGQIGIYANRLLEPGRAIDKHVYKRSHPWPTCNNVENIQRAIKPPSYDFENLAPVMPFKSNQVMEILELLETKKTDDKRTQLANSPTPTTRTKGTPRRDMGAALVRRAQTDGELPKLASRTTSSKTPLQSNKRKSATDENSRSTKRSASKSNSDETVETRNKTKIRTLVWSSLLKRDYDKGAEKTKLLYQIIKGGIQYIFRKDIKDEIINEQRMQQAIDHHIDFYQRMERF